MEDYNKVLDATEVAENANGVAAEKMTVYNESLAAAQNRLTASIQQFAQDSNLDQILAQAYDLLSKIVDILNLLINKSGILSPMIKALGIVFATTFASGMIQKAKDTSGAISEMIKSLTGVKTASGTVVGVIPALQAAFTGLTGVLSGTTTAAAAFGSVMTALGGPVGVAVAALGALLVVVPAVTSALNDLFPNAEQKIKSVDDAFESAEKDVEDAQKNLDDINAKIKEIDDKGTLTLADENEKKKLEEQRDVLEDILKYKQGIAKQKSEEQKEEYGKKYAAEYTSGQIDTSQQYSYIAQGADPYASEYSTQTEAYIKYYDTENASVEQLVANLQKLGDERRSLNKEDEDYGENLENNNKLTQENITALKQKAVSIGEDIAKMQELGLTDTEYYKNAVARYAQLQIYLDPSNWGKLKLEELIDDSNVEAKLKTFSAKARDAVAKAAEDSSEEAQDTADKAIENLDASITSGANQIVQKIMKDDELKTQFAQIFDIDPKDLDKHLGEVTDYVKQYLVQQYGGISKTLTDTVQPVVVSTATLVEKLGQEQVDLANKTKSLSDAYNAMAKNGKITSTQMNALLKQYPELSSAIEVQNGAIKVNIDVLKEKYNVLVDTEIKQKEQEIETTNTVIEQTEKKIAAYQKEMEAISEVLVGRSYILESYNDEAGLGISERSKSVESTENQLAYQQKKLSDAQANLKILQAALDDLRSQSLSYTGTGSSAADKAAKEFENSIKEKIKNLKGIVTLYSQQEDWMSSEVIKKYTDDYNKALSEIVNNPKARQIAADALNIDISQMSTQEAIDAVTKLLKEQAGTIEEARQKLQDNYLKGLKTAADAEKKVYDDAKKQIEELNKLTQDMIETGIDLLEKASNFVFNLLDNVSDKYDKQIDNLDKIMDDLDNQKDAFDDKIDAQKEYLKLQKDEMDNQKELAEKTKSIADIDARLAEMQYDDSAAAQAERLKLLDERAQKEKELKEFQDDTAYNDKINALDAQKKQFDTTIETQKKALEEQKQALEDSQTKFENTVSKVKSAFDGFIKILDSTVFKNLATNLLNSIDGDTLKNALYSWNKIFGTGIDADITSGLDAYNTLKKYGWNPGQNIQDYTNMFAQGSYAQEQVLQQIEQASAANTAGQLDLSKYVETINTLNKSWDTFKQNATAGITQVGENTQSTIQSVWDFGQKMLDQESSSGGNVIDTVAKGIKTTLKNGKNGISTLLNVGVQANQTLGINGQEILTQIGDTAKNVLGFISVSGGGVINTVIQAGGSLLSKIGSLALSLVGGISTVGSNAISTLANVGLQALSSISGVSTALFGSSGQLYSGQNSLNTGITNALDNTSKNLAQLGISLGLKIGGTGGLIAAAAGIAAGGVTATASNVSKLWKSNQSFGTKVLGTLANLTPVGMLWNLFSRHHSGADYVKKGNPALDKMLGLGNDETVSILKVGEAVVPTWANNANSSASGNMYTGNSATKAVTAAKQGTRLPSSAFENSSVVNTISMPINIQGNADESTVKLLKEQSEQIAKTVFRLINKQTNMSGYRNIRAATI